MMKLSPFIAIVQRNFLSNSASRCATGPLTWSYVHGASETPLLNQTIPEILRSRVEKHPDQDLFHFPKQHVRKTYSEFYADVFHLGQASFCSKVLASIFKKTLSTSMFLLHRARRLASGLLALGLAPGDRVGMWGPNIYEWTVTQFATAMAGLIMANINPAYQANELKYCMELVIAQTRWKLDVTDTL